MQIQINGESRQVNSQTVADLLQELELGKKKVAIELNRSLVKRERYASVFLAEGDCVEIVQFVGGG